MANTLKFGNGNWATKEGSTLAYNDENNNFKPLPFDFTRDSIGTYVDSDGLIKTAGDNVPRIDYTDSSDGALLLEPARTNLLPYSTLAFNGGSSPTGYSIGFQTGTFSYNQTTYKGQNAVKQTQSTAGRSYLDTGSLTLSTGVTYTFRMEIDLLNTSVVAGQFIMSFSGFDTNITKTLSDVDEFGILEFDFTFNTSVVGNIRIGLGCFGIAAGGQYMTWGMPQIEQGSYATSYIPTQGSTVTRLAESCSQTPTAGIIGQTEGTMFFETNNLFPSGTRSIALAYTSGSAYYQIYLTSTNQVRIDINGSLLLLSSSINLTVLNKIAFAYKSGENALYVNGVSLATSASTAVPTSINDFHLGNSLGNEQSGGYRQCKLYNTRLSNSELAALTQV